MPPTKRSTKQTAPAKRATVKRAAKRTTKATKKATKQATKQATRKPTKAPRTAKRRTGNRAPAGPDAIALLKQDHRDVEQLFKRFEKAGDGARTTKRQLVDSMIEALSRHASIEETVFYPSVRAEVRGADDDVLEALEEHHVVKVVLRELEDLDPRSERFDAKVTVMMENVRHHVKEEEGELFPEVRRALGRGRLRELGDRLRDAKKGAPTRPHPAGPDQPPANVLVEGAVAAVDRARTAGKRAVERVL